MTVKILLGLELMAAFTGLFWWVRKTSLIENAFLRAQRTLSKKTSLTRKLDAMLLYSGLNRYIPIFNTENWILLQLIFSGAVILIISTFKIALWKGVLVISVFAAAQYILVSILIGGNYKRVDDDLLKFLDFLGNYSITSGEITSILYQISGYLEEPLRGALEECYYEAQTFGDTSAALLSMTKKIQHPKFAEVVRNIEVTMRYSADFTILVNQSRRSVREHMRMRQERKSLAKEAWVNMMILGAMTVVIFMTVESLVGVSVEEVLMGTWIGRGCLMGIGVILLLFYRQVRAIDR